MTYRFIMTLNPKFITASKNPFIISIYKVIGMIFDFIPYLIIKYRSKKINSNIIEYKSKLNTLESVHNNVFKKTRTKKYGLILVSTIFDVLQTLSILIFCTKSVYNLWMFDILFISLFSYWILKTKFFKHQYLSQLYFLFFSYENLILFLNFSFTTLYLFIRLFLRTCCCFSGFSNNLFTNIFYTESFIWFRRFYSSDLCCKSSYFLFICTRDC